MVSSSKGVIQDSIDEALKCEPFFKDARFDLSWSCRKQINKSKYRIQQNRNLASWIMIEMMNSFSEIEICLFLVCVNNVSLKLWHGLQSLLKQLPRPCRNLVTHCAVDNFYEFSILTFLWSVWSVKTLSPRKIAETFYFFRKLLLKSFSSRRGDIVPIIFKWCFLYWWLHWSN